MPKCLCVLRGGGGDRVKGKTPNVFVGMGGVGGWGGGGEGRVIVIQS